MTNKEIMDNASCLMVTAGTDIKHMFAFCIRCMNDKKYLFIHKRGSDGTSCFSEQDLITAIPLDSIMDSIIFSANLCY